MGKDIKKYTKQERKESPDYSVKKLKGGKQK